MPSFRILRDDGAGDAITKQAFASYDEAHAVLERYYGDLWGCPGFVDRSLGVTP